MESYRRFRECEEQGWWPAKAAISANTQQPSRQFSKNSSFSAPRSPQRTSVERLRQQANECECRSPTARMGTGWSNQDWFAYFAERAGILEHDEGLSRTEAESRAFEICVVEWLNRHPVQSCSGLCAHCGRPEGKSSPIVPYGYLTNTAWVHPECWHEWHRGRTKWAEHSLESLGLLPFRRPTSE